MDQIVTNQINNAIEHAATERAKNAARNLGQGSAPQNIEKIERTARDFEAVFIAEMMKPMFEGIKTDGVFGGGQGEEIFRGMMINEYGKLLANNGSIGLADQVKAEMIRLQEGSQKETMQMAYAAQNARQQRSAESLNIIDVQDISNLPDEE